MKDLAGNVRQIAQSVAVDTAGPQIDLPANWKLGKTIAYRVTDGVSGLAPLRVVIEDENERYPKVAWDEGVSGNSFGGEINWDGKWKDGTTAQPGTYLAWVKATDQAGNEGRDYGRVTVPQPRYAAPLLALPTQTAAFTPLAILPPQEPPQAAQSLPVAPAPGGTWPSEGQKSVGIIPFRSEAPQPQAPAADSNDIFWGGAAAAALGAFLAEIARRKEEEIKTAAAKAAKQAARRFSGYRAKIRAKKLAELEAEGAARRAEADIHRQAVEELRTRRKEGRIEGQMPASPPKYVPPGPGQRDPWKDDAHHEQAQQNEADAWAEAEIRRAQEMAAAQTQAAQQKAYERYRAQEVAAQVPTSPREEKLWWQKAWDWTTGHAGKIVKSVKKTSKSISLRKLKFNQLEDGHISVSADTPPGTRLDYRATVAEEGFDFAGTRYNPETIASTTEGGLLKGAVSKSGLIFAGVVSLGQNMLHFGRGKEFGSEAFWDATVKNREFWVSTGVDFVVSVVVGLAAAALVAGAIATAPLWLPASAVAIVAAPAVAIVATMGVGMAIGWGVNMTGFPNTAKSWLNGLLSGK